MGCHSLRLVTVLFAAIGCSLANERAPHITTVNQGPDIPYKVGEDIILRCHADGSPNITYSWKKDGKPLAVSDSSEYILQPSGNLVIKAPTASDDGEYNCMATNKLGTAVGMKLKVQRAVIEPFPTVTEPTVVRPIIGDSLVIRCTPPTNYPNPKGSTYFGYNIKDSNKLENIANDNRVLLDYEGNLYFANVLAEDSLSQFGETANYLCVVNNAHLGAYVQGNDHKLVPQATLGRPTYRAVTHLWPLTTSTIAIKGQTKYLKCIFGGLPTPNVTWHSDRDDQRFVVTPEGYGTEIRFDNVDLQDEGYYTCSASNSPSGAVIPHRIKMTVQSAPFWSKKPVDLDVDEESDIVVDCSVAGTPKPTVTWSINGAEVNEANFTGRKSLVGDKLRYQNVVVGDSQVIQCMAENEHGTILTNIILKVNAETPSFLETPADTKVVKGTTVALKCNSRGAPKPTIEWTQGSLLTRVSGRRFNVLGSGTLVIQDAQLEDTDTYHCKASNKNGFHDASARLTVRSPTVIRSVPTDRVVEATDEVVIPCDVSTDEEEASNLVVEWRKGGAPINFTTESHMYMDKADHSLHIRSSKVKDTAGYTCNASNGLDSAESELFQLKVKDRPDPPYDVHVIQCGAEEAELSWHAGSDNNDPITEFTVHYNSSSSNDSSTRYRRSGENFLPKERFSSNVRVRPWTKYTFYVTASNSLGRSRLSGPTGKECYTAQVTPYRNPTGVCGSLKGSTQLVIVWDPLREDEFNGEGFHYVVSYRRLHSNEPVRREKIFDPKLRSLPIYNQPSFNEYEISVQSANKIGVTSLQSGERKKTYSGEGKPLEVAQNFRKGEVMNGSYAEFLWEPVDTSLDRIQGFFRGYLIEFWRDNDTTEIRSEEILIETPFELCPALPGDPITIPPNRRRRNHHRSIRSSSPVRGSTNKLWPRSRISAAVRVLSQKESGNRSNIIEFISPDGAPGKVSNLKVIGRGSGHLLVEWQLPVDASGPIVAYDVEYRVAPPAVGRTFEHRIPDRSQLTYKIRQLDFSTKYQITVIAITSAGVGEPEIVFGETLPLMDPDVPLIGKVTAGDNSANVSWIPSGKQPPENPGSNFYVEYKPYGEDVAWQRVDPDPDNDDNWVNITDLEPRKYEVRVVATTGGDGDLVKESRSKTWIVYVGPNRIDPEPETQGPDTAPLTYHQASTGWFIILMCIIALLLLVLLVVCILRRSRGDVYPVYEKEKMWRHQPLAPDETPFGEYTAPSDNPNLSRSQGSLDSDEKPMDSDSDSLGEYEDQDASKFNEDGSFIGIYTGKQRADPKAPTSMNTSV